ncbi:DNA-binding protein [Enterobacter sp. BNK-16]|uniref:YobI family P-loop NTPase n=2 Tax=Enterobacter TaxID=547 RepID=UPI003861CBD7
MDVLGKAIELCKSIETLLIKAQSRNPSLDASSTYDTLAPKCINNENMQEYFRALKFALSKKEVRNIAITGNYGAGKSTVVSSFMKYHCSEKYMNVSLAGFDMMENDKNTSLTNQEVELSILQQILYKENRDKLPDSKIDRILNRSLFHTLKTYFSLIKIAIPTTAFLGILFFERVSEWFKLPQEWTNILHENAIARVLALTILAFISLFFLTQTASRVGIFDKKIRLGKIAFLSGGMEFNDKESSSLLNNCLDEIVYFFSRRPYKIVVFEDLDRLGTPEIFVKLREINKIINNNLSNKKPVRFIYAVRDDMFMNADGRTKFFDFILPIVPFMDSRNAFTLLKNKTPSLDKSSDKHLKSIAPYINDMRSLLNIINEFNTFSKIVDNSKNTIKLFALVFYKNIYTLDYHLADKKTGLLYLFIHNYRTQRLHAEYFESLDERLEELFETSIKLEEDIANTPYDIRKDILIKFIPELLWGKVFIAYKNNNNRFTLCDSAELVKNEEYFLETFSGNKTLYVGYTNQYGNDQFSSLTAEATNILLSSYYDRVKLVGQDKTKTFQLVNREIRDLENTIRSRNAIPLDELIKSSGRDKFEVTAKQYLDEMEMHDYVSKQQLHILRTDMQYGGLDALYVLLSGGLLMQDFMSYRSIFHEGSMTVNDNDFIKAIGQGLEFEKSNQDFYIDDAEKVILELAEQKRIYSDGALHYQLLTHIIDINSRYLTGMVASLFRKSDQYIYNAFEILSIKFVTYSTFEAFVIRALKISGYLERMLIALKTNRESPYNTNISITVLSCTSPEKYEEKEEFRNYLHFIGSKIIHHIKDDNLPAFLTNILKVNVCYNELFTPKTPNEFSAISFIAENNLYQITKENVGVVLYSYVHSDETINPEYAQKRPWSIITQYKLSAPFKYYTANINTFVQNVFVYADEPSHYIKEMLARNELSDESKEKIVKIMDFTLSELTGLTSESTFNDGNELISFEDLFYQYDRVIPSWSALMDYISIDCNAAILHDWLTNHALDLAKLSKPSIDVEDYVPLYKKIICSDLFDDNTYETLLSSIEINIEQIDDQLSVRNFGRLVKLGKIILSNESYRIIESTYIEPDEKLTEYLVLLFSQHKDIFLSNSDFYLGKNKSSFDKILDSLMLSDLFNDDIKAQLVLQYSEYYLDLDISKINLPNSVSLLSIKLSNNLNLNAILLARMISRGYRNKPIIADICHNINEADLSNVFIKRTQATITANNDDLVYLILEYSRDAGIIKDFEKRDDSKITVTITRERDDIS